MAAAEPQDDMAWRELCHVLDAELGRLPEKYRAPLVLRYLEGKSNAEAARELGWPTGSMAKRLARGRQLLHERLAGRGVVLTAAGLGTLLTTNASARVPVPLSEMTCKAAVAFVAGQATAGLVSTQATALADSTLSALGSTKLKVGALVLGVSLLLATGVGLLDTTRNTRGQALAAPYCVRPFPGATVSTPLKWSEVRRGLDPAKFTIRTMRQRLDQLGDLWAPVIGPGVDLAKLTTR
jgi:hypothetical protein